MMAQLNIEDYYYNITDNWLFKYFWYFYEIYACTKYLVESVYLFSDLFQNLSICTAMTVESLYSANEILKCFVLYT